MRQSVMAVFACFLLTNIASPQQFAPVDTSKLIGSPDPLPLQAEAAFPELRFERPVELTYPLDDTDRLFVAAGNSAQR